MKGWVSRLLIWWIGVSAWMLVTSAVAGTPSALGDLALKAVTSGGLAQGSIGGSDAVAVSFGEQGSCKMVGAWYAKHQRGVANFKVCGTVITAEGAVAKLPMTPESTKLVREVLKSAVLSGSATKAIEEFVVRATRLPREGSGVSCMTELVITNGGLLSFYGVQDACL